MFPFDALAQDNQWLIAALWMILATAGAFIAVRISLAAALVARSLKSAKKSASWPDCNSHSLRTIGLGRDIGGRLLFTRPAAF